MFDFERATDYIRSLELPGSALCEEIQKDALAGDVPIIRPETASFLLFLISLKKPLSLSLPALRRTEAAGGHRQGPGHGPQGPAV